MKIKSIAAICKKNKNIAIFERYSDDGNTADPAPFPSMVVIYNGERVKE